MIALLCGQGALPSAIAAASAEPPLVCALEGFEPDGLDIDLSFRLETMGTLIATLKQRGISEVCLAGVIRRPQIDPSKIDAATFPLVPVFQKALMAGDDGALRAVMSVLEHSGLTVRAAHEIAPDLLLQPGCATAAKPSDADQKDAARAADIIMALAPTDVGQACVVYKGQALAIETVFGTDWMLQSLTQRPDAGGGVLYKAPKLGQDRRADMPTIGPDTVTAAVAAGLSGIAIEAGGVIVLDRDRVIAECDRLGLFLTVLERAS
ncbi:LpxI family protein [Ruegeria marina]|uniref:Phosphatidate cytidylyltransferase n=1 Tax=Ruegeria marina TaxID=639004 RepID=A0A1G6JBM4_9RHOB|nr:UDP-2,3-diacylglucosamine diphosphatase LpxI [Ruegeria marina]SDC16138.1 hypothetical protein SAMN04488239_101321 [Ruegeria marina]